MESVNCSSVSSAKKTAGRRSGTKNWSESELDTLLDAVEGELPCGSKQWDLVAAHMYTCQYSESRTAGIEPSLLNRPRGRTSLLSLEYAVMVAADRRVFCDC